MPLINGKTCYATVGNKGLSGSLVTLRLMCANADAQAIFDWFVNNAYYNTVGESGGDYIYTVKGWFQRDRSSVQPREVYSELLLVFDRQSVLGLVQTSGNQNRYDPVYDLSTQMEERPIEQHPNFRCSWTYNLYELVPVGGSTSAVPAWATTDTNPAAIHDGYLWSHTPPASPDPAKEYKPVQPATDFGMDSYLIPRPVVTSTIYYRTRDIQSSDIVYQGQLKAPPETFIYPATQSCWLVTNCDISDASDDLRAVTVTYMYNAEGWKTKVYPLASS